MKSMSRVWLQNKVEKDDSRENKYMQAMYINLQSCKITAQNELITYDYNYLLQKVIRAELQFSY